MVNIQFPTDEDDELAQLRLQIVTDRMKSAPGYGDHDAGEHAYSGTGDIDGSDADYLNIEDELDCDSNTIQLQYARNQPQIAERMDYHLKEVGFHLSYMAEGGANVLFKIELSGASKIPLLPPLTRTKMLALRGMLLRVRKSAAVSVGATRADLVMPIVDGNVRIGAPLNSTQIMDGFERRIKPIFHSKYLLRQKLIRLPKGITRILMPMVQRAEQEGIRDARRAKGAIVPQSDHKPPFPWPEDYGILIQDLSPRTAIEHLIEFKPKWLVMSPSAPASSKRCRTCALREMRRAYKTEPGRGDSNFCPLDLLSGKAYILRPALRKLWTLDEFPTSDEEDGEWVDAITGKECSPRFKHFENGFRQKVQPLLGRLKALQGIHRHAGLQDFASATDDEVSIAMALRDCSVFLRVEAAHGGNVLLNPNVALNPDSSPAAIEILDVKLADLDLKSPGPEKRQKWMEMERKLVEEGWYEGRMAPGVVKDQVICRVSRTCT